MKRVVLRRRCGLRATKGLKRSGPLKARKPPEKGNPAYRTWIRSLPCLVCTQPTIGELPGGAYPPRQRTKTECAHVRTKRLARGRENDGDTGNCVPLCGGPSGHHAEQHTIGIRSFEAKYGLNLAAEAQRLERARRIIEGQGA